MKAKILRYLLEGLSFLVRKILLFDLGLVVLIGVSFLIWGLFTDIALSERLVLTGIGVALIAGLLVFCQTSGGCTFGVPGHFQCSVHGQSMINFNIEVRQAIETKMSIYPPQPRTAALLTRKRAGVRCSKPSQRPLTCQ